MTRAATACAKRSTTPTFTGDPDDIVFQAGLTGTITLTTGQLNVTRPVTITGPGQV
jgi:hypothetical protein